MTQAGPLVVIGDALLDRGPGRQASRRCPDAPAPVLDDLTESCRPGGAALAALLAAADGDPVVLVAPFGDDPASATVRALLEPQVTVVPIPLDGPLPDKARFRAGGQTLLRADGPAGPARSCFPGGGRRDRVGRHAAGVRLRPGRDALMTGSAPHWPGARPGCRWSGIRTHAGRSRCPGPGWLPRTTARPGPPPARPPRDGAASRASSWTRPASIRGEAPAAARPAWQADGVAVTLGAHGTVLAQGGPVPLIVPARPVQVTDTCGAGDRFAGGGSAGPATAP